MTKVGATIEYLRRCQAARAAGQRVAFTTDPGWLVNEAINRRAGWLEDPHNARDDEADRRPVPAEGGGILAAASSPYRARGQHAAARRSGRESRRASVARRAAPRSLQERGVVNAAKIKPGATLRLTAAAETRYDLSGTFEVSSVERRDGYLTPWIYVKSRRPEAGLLVFRPSDLRPLAKEKTK